MAYGDLSMDAPSKPNKGMEGGACNRQSCQAEPAMWFNHGSNAWYCDDCRNDIEFDDFNLRDWRMNWQPKCGHPMFETRAMMMERKLAEELDETPPEHGLWKEPIEAYYPDRRSRRSGFASIAGLALAGMGMSFAPRHDTPFVFPLRDNVTHFTSAKPLSKRQKRRLRGKALKAGEQQ